MLWKRDGMANFRIPFLDERFKKLWYEALTFPGTFNQLKWKEKLLMWVQTSQHMLGEGKSYFMETWNVENVFGINITDNKNKKSFKAVGSDLQCHFILLWF